MPKAIADALTVARLYQLPYQRSLLSNLLLSLLTPLSMLVLTHYFLPAQQAKAPRLIAGAIVFSVGFATVATLSSTVYSERFYRRFKLVVMSPIHKLSYAAGLIIVGVARSLPSIACLLLMAPLFGIEVHLSLWLLPVTLLTALSLSGVAFLIGTWVPSLQMGEICTNLASTTAVMLSPIFYESSRLPAALGSAAQLSPYTHAANSLTSLLNGNGPLYGEVAFLAVLTVCSLTIGALGMRWRDV